MPTFKGYALRCLREAEPEITRQMNPQEAEVNGPTLGVKMETAWVIRGVPSFATRAQIVANLAKDSGNGWPGWNVRPRKTLSSISRHGGTATWVVDAAAEPPLRAITLNKAAITIEMFQDKLAPKSKATAFTIRLPKNTFDINPGQLYEDEGNGVVLPSEGAGYGKQQNPEHFAMEVDPPPMMPASFTSQTVNKENSPQAKDVVMISAEKKECDEEVEKFTANKRRNCGEEEERNTIESMFTFMKIEAEKRQQDAARQSAELTAQLNEKDKIIAGLNNTILGLQTEMAELRDLIKKQVAAKE